jgi:hypothetical protein
MRPCFCQVQGVLACIFFGLGCWDAHDCLNRILYSTCHVVLWLFGMSVTVA